MKPRIILYYQTFCGLHKIINTNSSKNITHIHLSSIHFGKDDKNNKYIHLNNYSPYNKIFDKVWKELEEINKKGIKIILMIGGAGGGFTSLFEDFDYYYSLLIDLIKTKNIISGVDLDVEEDIGLDNIKMIIKKIKNDLGNNFTISLAPVQSSLEYNYNGLGGFKYNDLLNSEEGKMIDYLNGQFYYDYSLNSYNKVINNNYISNQIVMGMIASSKDNMEKNYQQVANIYEKYKDNFGGVFLWEYSLYPDFVNDILNIL